MPAPGLIRAAACLALLFVTAHAVAEEPPVDRAAAAAAFDDGVARFDGADYAAAARSFLRADDLAPSAAAIVNAIAAARKGNDYLLVVEAAERGLKRGATNPDLATSAGDALEEAARNLAQVKLACEPEPCSLLFDGIPTQPGARYLLPGTHSAVATGSDGTRGEEQLRLAAGATYQVMVHAARRSEPNAAALAPTPSQPERAAQASARPERAMQQKKPLSPAVFYVGVGVTAVLVGVATWSGIDALSAKGEQPKDDVLARALRSDILWGSAAVVGGLTVASGFLWVEWGDRNKGGASAGVVPVSGGAIAATQGRF